MKQRKTSCNCERNNDPTRLKETGLAERSPTSPHKLTCSSSWETDSSTQSSETTDITARTPPSMAEVSSLAEVPSPSSPVEDTRPRQIAPPVVSKSKLLIDDESDHDSLFTLSTQGKSDWDCEISWLSRGNEEDESSFPSRPPSALGSVPGSLQYSVTPSEELELLDEGYFIRGFVDVGHLPHV